VSSSDHHLRSEVDFSFPPEQPAGSETPSPWRSASSPVGHRHACRADQRCQIPGWFADFVSLQRYIDVSGHCTANGAGWRVNMPTGNDAVQRTMIRMARRTPQRRNRSGSWADVGRPRVISRGSPARRMNAGLPVMLGTAHRHRGGSRHSRDRMLSVRIIGEASRTGRNGWVGERQCGRSPAPLGDASRNAASNRLPMMIRPRDGPRRRS
jgi:hypothetical protein